MGDAVVGALNLALNAVSAIPDPISSAVIALINSIWTAVQQTTQNKHQIRLLFKRVCDILCLLNVPQNYGDDAIQRSVKLLIANLENVLGFIVHEQKKSFLRGMLTADDLKLRIEDYERQIWSSCFAFQNAALLSANRKLDDLWELANSQANQQSSHADQHTAYLRDISDKLEQMRSAVSSPAFLDALLLTVHVDPVHTMTAMQAVLERDDSGRAQLRPEEREFLRAGVKRLRTQTEAASQVKIKSWTVTGLEVERGFLLGSDPTSNIRIGRWLGNLVGILDLKDAQTVKRMVKLWKGLRSTRVQTFLGASTTDQPPFILLPHLTTTVVDYIKSVPNPNFTFLAADFARGLDYLHSQDPPIVHGGLRPTTVYVDERSNLVLTSTGIRMSDLALTADEVRDAEEHLTPWKAPEQLAEPPAGPSPAADIYAFGSVVKAMLDAVDADRGADTLFDGKALLERLVARCHVQDAAARPSAAEVLQLIAGEAPLANEGKFFTSATMAGLDEADGDVGRWRLVPTVRRAQIALDQNYRFVYLRTPPIEGRGEHPVRTLSFEICCHDQGKEATSANPRDGTWTWVEATLLRKVVGEDGVEREIEVNYDEEIPGVTRGHMVDPTGFEVLRVPFADSTPRLHRITFDHRHPLVRAVRQGDVILLYPKARFPGWVIYMISAEVHVITEH